MNSSPLRFILALVIGVFIAYIVTTFLQSLLPSLLSYSKLAEGVGLDEYEDYLAKLPIRAVIALVVCLAIGAFSGGYTAARITKIKKNEAGIGVGAFMLVILAFMVIAFSFPLFFAIGLLLVPIPCSYLGARFAIN